MDKRYGPRSEEWRQAIRDGQLKANERRAKALRMAWDEDRELAYQQGWRAGWDAAINREGGGCCENEEPDFHGGSDRG